MTKRSLSEQLDQAVEGILIDPQAATLSVDPSLASLVRLVADLRNLPSDAFRETLRQNLIRRASMTATTTAEGTRQVSPIREGSLRTVMADIFYDFSIHAPRPRVFEGFAT